MRFIGQKRTVVVDADYSQIAELEMFWNEMRELSPNDLLYGLGTKWTEYTGDYYIGKIDKNWEGGVDSIEIPDDNWKEFGCKVDDADIKKMYRKIYQQGTLDYEIESMVDGVFTTRVHFANKGEKI